MATKKASVQKKPTKTPPLEPFVITRTFDAPRALVVRAWTEREQLMRWWGPKGITVLPGKLDLKTGGIFHYAMQQTDGRLMWGKWIIREVALPDRLVWVNCFSDEVMGTTRHPMVANWPLEILTTVTFVDEGDKTKVTVLWEPIVPTPAEAETFASMHASMQQGWSGSFETLAEHLPRMVGAIQRVTPYLVVSDAAKAIAYYKQVFDASERLRTMAEDGKRILHAALILNGGSLLLNDEFAEFGGPVAPRKGEKSPVAIALEISSPAEVDAMYHRAVTSGSEGTMPPDDTFWGARFAMFTDPFGHRWMLNGMKPKE